MTDQDGGQAAAGWYQQDDGTQRYWDGDQWTEHTAPGAETTATEVVPTAPTSSQFPKWAIPLIACAALAMLAIVIGGVAGGGDDDEEASSGDGSTTTSRAVTSAAESANTESTTTEATTTTTAPPTTTIPPAQLQAEIDAEAQRACDLTAPSGEAAPINFEDRWTQVGATESAVQALADNCATTKRDEALNNAGPVDVDTVIRDPDAVTGQLFTLVANIVQFDAATGACAFRGYWDNEPREYSFEYAGDNAVFTAAEPCPVLDGIDQNDVVRLTVEGAGSFTYDTQIGGSTTVPAFEVLRSEIISKG